MSDSNQSPTLTDLKKKKNWLLPVGGGLVGIIILTIIAVVPIGASSLLSKSLDKSGNHLAAFALEQTYKGKLKDINFANVLNTKSTCDSFTQSLNPTAIDISKGSLDTSSTISLLNSDAAKQFQFETTFSGMYNTEKLQADADLRIAADFNLDTIKTIAKETDSTDDSNLPAWGQSRFQVRGQARIDRNAGYVYLPQVDLTNKEFTSKNQLNNWYSQDFKNDSSSKESKRQEGLNELSKVVSDELKNLKYSDAVYKSINQNYVQDVCKKSGELKVSDVQDFTLGNSLLSSKLSARRVTVPTPQNLNDAFKKSSSQENKNLVIELLNSFRPKYPQVKTALVAMQKIAGETESLTVPTEAEYAKSIDEGIKSVLDSTPNEDTTKSTDDLLQYVEITIDPSEVFFETDSGNIAGSRSTITIKPTQKSLKEVKSNTAKNLIKDGVRITNDMWNLRSGNAVKDIEIPANTKPLKDFSKDVLNTDIGKKIDTEVQKNKDSELKISSEDDLGAIDFPFIDTPTLTADYTVNI
jgi:hypothetical protein